MTGRPLPRTLVWILLAIIVGGLLWLARSATQPAPMPRVAWLGYDSSIQAIRFAAFRDGLRDHGYVEGRNLELDVFWADGKLDRLPAIAAELVARKPDVIVTAAPPMVRAVQAATSTIPIVMSVHDPVGMGIAQSLARPGNNITGVAFQDSELSTKRLDLLRQLVPGLKRVAVIWNKLGGGSATPVAVKDAATALGLETLLLEVNGRNDITAAIKVAEAWSAQGVLQIASPLITQNHVMFIDLLRAHRLPAACEMKMYVDAGCLMTYSADLSPMFNRLAHFVDRILKGESPSEIAIEQPREFDFVINLATARELGLGVSPLLLLQTTRTIP